MLGLDTLIKSFQYTKKKEKKIKTQESDIVLEKKFSRFSYFVIFDIFVFYLV